MVDEYKKFLFLCCITESGITPSDSVDQVWHLHLTNTKSYWIELCRNTIEGKLHHNPTKGGSKEVKKFDSFYTSTHNLYRDKFGQEPPMDIWQDNHKRFNDIHFQRINLKAYWLLKKPSRKQKQSLVLLGIALFAFLFIQATFDASTIGFIGFPIVLGIVVYRYSGKGGDGSGCSASGCSSDSGNGCSSGCSGCSASGCSGCGGGGD